MKNSDINIRDPFVLVEGDTYYMYGTRAARFGQWNGGFDVYVSKDLEDWSEPVEVFNSDKYGMNICVNWAPEVHKYKGAYYMFATFTMDNGRRGTHILKADSPLGPFVPHSDKAVTPHDWEALDGTLYIEDDVPYMVFCHEHIQVIDGTMCYVQLSDDLTHAVGEPVYLFSASSPYWADKKPEGEHYITDGPFMYRTKDDVLLMIWSTFIGDDYVECVVRFNDGTIKGSFEHLPVVIDDDGGHGMLFKANDKLYLTYHTPNQTDYERPAFIEMIDCGDRLEKAGAFAGVKKNFGFGCMRLKLDEAGEVDLDNFKAMVDEYLAQGFNYFDTAHGYIDYKSEGAIKKCLVECYPRDSFILADKLSEGFFKTEEEILPLFEKQLERCGVEYFDYYLMHAQNAEYFEKYQKLHAYDIVNQLIKEGRVKHLGISFHDTADVLDHILTNRPEIEVVQLQFNYLDYESDRVQSKLCYDVCVKHGKPVIVMEPVKGGSLVNLPAVAQEIYDELDGGSNASYAIRFAASFDNVKMVLSGMNDVAQMQDNLSYMKEFKPLDDKEMQAVAKVTEILKNQDIIPCTACEYCVNECPQSIVIPEVFKAYNKSKLDGTYMPSIYDGRCVECGACEHICPQKLEIRKLLKEINNE